MVPYVGQLLAVQGELRKLNMTVLLSERDEQELQDTTDGAHQGDGGAGDEEEGEDDGEEDGGPSGGGKGGGGGVKSSGGAKGLAQVLGGTQVVTDVGRRIRVATVDNFQVRRGCGRHSLFQITPRAQHAWSTAVLDLSSVTCAHRLPPF